MRERTRARDVESNGLTGFAVRVPAMSCSTTSGRWLSGLRSVFQSETLVCLGWSGRSKLYSGHTDSRCIEEAGQCSGQDATYFPGIHERRGGATSGSPCREGFEDCLGIEVLTEFGWSSRSERHGGESKTWVFLLPLRKHVFQGRFACSVGS